MSSLYTCETQCFNAVDWASGKARGL